MIKVIKKENVEKENVKIIWKFSSENSNPVELMQNFDCETTTIQCYNLTDCKDYNSNYGIVLFDKHTKVSSYAYFNSLSDMFTYYDVLHKHYNFILPF